MTLRLNCTTAVLAVVISLCCQTAPCHAHDRKLVWSYETTTAAQGEWEYEQWVTYKGGSAADPSSNRLDFREEIEHGITDNWQIAFYLSDWRVSWDATSSQTQWRDVAFETIYRFTEPDTDILGSAIYGEVKVGDNLLVLEGKLLLEKDIGPLVMVYNFTLEAKWEGTRLTESVGEYKNSFGLSHPLGGGLSAGFELEQFSEAAAWEDWSASTVYAGPNAQYRSGKFFVTAAPQWQVTNQDSEPDFRIRMIVGLEF